MEKIKQSSSIGEIKETSPLEMDLEETKYKDFFLEAIYQLHRSFDRRAILQTAVKLTRKILATDRVIIYSLEENSYGRVIAESVASRWPKTLGQLIEDPCFGAHYWEKYENGRVSAVNNIYKAKLTPCHLGQLEPFGVKANLVVPILSQGSLLGLFIVHQCSTPRIWQPKEIDVLIQLSRHMVSALEKAKLLRDYRELQAQAKVQPQWLTSFTNFIHQIQSCTQEEEIFEMVVKLTRKTLAADRVLVYSLQDTSYAQVIAESIAPGWPQALGQLIDDPCFSASYWEKYRDGRVSVINDIYQAQLTPCHLGQLEPFAVRANLVVPIINRVSLVGLLIAHQCSSPRVWQKEEISWFQQIAMQTGLVINEKRLLDLFNKSG